MKKPEKKKLQKIFGADGSRYNQILIERMKVSDIKPLSSAEIKRETQESYYDDKLFQFSMLIKNLSILFWISLTIPVFYSCKKQPNVSLTYASGPAIIEAPAHAAFEKGFFEEQGITLDLKIYPDGKTALSALLKGEVQLAGVMATPFVYESFKRNDFRIMAVVEHPKFHHLLVNEKHISSAADLKGKKVGVTFGTSGEYLMHTYLVSNEINIDEIEIFDLTGEEMVKEFISGKIDAMFSWNPYINEVKKQMIHQVILLNDFRSIPPSWVIVAKKKFIDEHFATIEYFLRGLQKGVVFANENPEQLIALHKKVSGKDITYLVPSEMEGRFKLTLRQELLLDLEKQARWVISKTDTLQGNMPDFLSLIDLEAMQKVSPETVTLIK